MADTPKPTPLLGPSTAIAAPTAMTEVPAPLLVPTPKSVVKDRSLPQSPKSPVKKRNVGVPKFLRFLYEILEKEDKSIICWSHKGTAFQIRRPDALSKGILPRYFKHNKVSSFQRQLNYFGFKKWTKTQTVVCTFSHPNFIHHKPDNIKLIKRKERGLNEGHTTPSANLHGKHTKAPPAPSSSTRVPPIPGYTWTFPSAPAVTTSAGLAQQPYDVLLYDSTTFFDKRVANPEAFHPHPHLMPMQILSTQIHIGDVGPPPSDCWGDVLLAEHPPLHHSNAATAMTNYLCPAKHMGTGSSGGDDAALYFDMWDDDDDDDCANGIVVPSSTVGPYTQAMQDSHHGLGMIKHEDDMYCDVNGGQSLTRFYVDT
ncbi:hypothetical protein DYB32_000815 [Aphanomyces invadans]|uniref:HSF-type DNA-binding domain-containing protein n=1 Tax=Aphanomyces invadans TaxID=157072 RepID=A0A3R6ZWM3_9STRA|nr:hypothetical protein DYB32_000815 [Aphanomyces invadans]